MNEDFRKTAPAPLASIPFSIPQPFETALDNGLKIVVYEDKRLPLVSFRLAFPIGEAHDPNDAIGQTAALVSMLNEGTLDRSSRQLAEEIERLGANLSASSNADNIVVSASALSLYGSDILKLLGEIILKPTFPEDELRLYQRNTIENLKFQRSQPGFLADEQVSRIIYGEHPYRTAAPRALDVEKITREDLISLRDKILLPNIATLIVVGDVEPENIVDQIEGIFGGWQKGDVVDTVFPAPPERTKTTLTIVDRPGSAQSNIVLSNLAIRRDSDDYFAFLVMNQILGAGASSRLFMNLREEKGYTYGAYSSIDARRLAGSFEATSEVRSAVTGDSLKEFFYELNRIRDEKVSDEELNDAKNFLTGVFPIRAETQEGLTNLIVSQKLYNLADDYLQTYREKINEVSVEDIERAAKKYIMPDKIAIVIVGDAEAVLEQVKLYASETEIFDIEGNPRDLKNYHQSENTEPADISGKWNLTLAFQGQEIPVTLSITQKRGEISGALDSVFGQGEISGGKVTGNKISALIQIEIQGQTLDLNINGMIDGDSIKGFINSETEGFPAINFTGNR